MKRKTDIFNDLIAYYWPPREFRKMKREIGAEDFEKIDWRKEAAWRFVWENSRDCEFIFNHRHLKSTK